MGIGPRSTSLARHDTFYQASGASLSTGLPVACESVTVCLELQM